VKTNAVPKKSAMTNPAIKRPFRVLYLSYHFPPKEGIACVRTTNSARHLARLGWKVTVVTPGTGLWSRKDEDAPSDQQLKDDGIDLHRTGYGFKSWEYTFLSEQGQKRISRWVGIKVRKLIKRINPIYELCWSPSLHRSLPSLSAMEFDIILATGAPWASFACAQALARQTGRPYLLDYRDLWTVNNPYGGSRPRREQRAEAALFASSSGVTVVSEGMRDSLVERFGSRNKVHVVTNGFNPDEYLDIEPLSLAGRAIVYTGTVSKPKKILDPLFKALRRLGQDPETQTWGARFYYFGPNCDLVKEAAEKYEVAHLVEMRGNRPRREALAALKAAYLTVVITSVLDENNLSMKGVVTGKVFESLALGRPILLIAPDPSDAAKIIGSHGVRCSGTDSNGILKTLQTYLAMRHPDYEPPSEGSWPKVIQHMDFALRQGLADYKTSSQIHKAL